MPRALGVDVSHFRPVHDWAAVIGHGVSFVGMKATEGATSTDPMLVTHRIGYRSQPFTLGLYYHFARPGDPVKQAQHFLDVVGPLLPRERLALDVEGDGAPDIDWIAAFIGALPPDRRHILYTSNRIWQQIGNPALPPALDGAVDLWAPRYQSGDNEPVVPAAWPSWTFWQFSEDYPCPGIVGGVDANWFNGDEMDLSAYAALDPPAVA